MQDGTLKQASKVLSLFEETPGDQIQALLESGLLADLRDGNIAEVKRDDLRRLVGLVPLSSTVAIMIDPTKKVFARNMKQESGWELISDNTTYEAGEVKLELCEFLGSGENSVRGTTMAERALKLGANLGQKHAEAFLENQHLIPKEWRRFYLIFPGTVWLGSRGSRRVPCLHWLGGPWCLSFLWLGGGWGSGGRLLRPRK